LRSIIKDRSGKISGVMAALLAMIIILIYTRVASTPKGSEDAFFTVYGALKWLLKALDLLKYIEEYLKGFEEFLRYVQGTFLWPITISILSLVVTIFAIIAIYYGTVITVGTTARVLGLRGSWELIIDGKYEVIRIKDELNSFRKKWGEEKK